MRAGGEIGKIFLLAKNFQLYGTIAAVFKIYF